MSHPKNIRGEDSLNFGLCFFCTLYLLKSVSLQIASTYKLVSKLAHKTLLLTLMGNFLESHKKHRANE